MMKMNKALIKGSLFILFIILSVFPPSYVLAGDPGVFVSEQDECYKLWRNTGRACYREACDYQACVKSEMVRPSARGLTQEIDPGAAGSAHVACTPHYDRYVRCMSRISIPEKRDCNRWRKTCGEWAKNYRHYKERRDKALDLGQKVREVERRMNNYKYHYNSNPCGKCFGPID